MTKQDYECAARIAQTFAGAEKAGKAVVQAFVELFLNDNSQFDEARFRAACVPGANIKAKKPKHGAYAIKWHSPDCVGCRE